MSINPVNRWNNTKRAGLLLFIVALMFRLTLFILLDDNRISPDSVGYHTMAVNLVHGNGLSLQREVPFERSFFREPGYPVFLAGIYAVVNLFHPVEYIQGYNLDTHQLDHLYPEIVAAKIVQSIMGAVSIVLVFLILARIASFKKAFWASMVSALFIQLASQNFNILRESLVLFLLLALNIVFLAYIDGKRTLLWLSLIGITIGLLVLVFQVHIVFLPLFFILTLVHSKQWWQSVKHTGLVTGVVIIVVFPHCFSAYSCYPDVRVFKTFGTSLTHEMFAYVSAHRTAAFYGLLTKEEAENIARPEWGRSSREQFERSFNGYYISKADSLNTLTHEGLISSRRLNNYARNIEKSLFLYTSIGGYPEMEFVYKYGALIGFPLRLFPRLVGLFGFLGMMLIGRKYIPYLISFIAYALLFWMLGSEGRRMIILQPFLIFFAILFVQAVFLRTKKLFCKRDKQFCKDNEL